MRVYNIVNYDDTGYLKFETPKVENQIEDRWKINTSAAITWHQRKPGLINDIVRLRSKWPNMAFSSRVKEHLENTTIATGNWTKLIADDVVFWIFEPTLIVDALDESLSDLSRLPDGMVIGVNSHAFHAQKVPGDRIFLIKSMPYDLLCTDHFVNLSSSQGWEGIRFQPIWDSELKPFSIHPNKKEIISRPEIYGPGGIAEGFQSSWPEEWKSKQ